MVALIVKVEEIAIAIIFFTRPLREPPHINPHPERPVCLLFNRPQSADNLHVLLNL